MVGRMSNRFSHQGTGPTEEAMPTDVELESSNVLNPIKKITSIFGDLKMNAFILSSSFTSFVSETILQQS